MKWMLSFPTACTYITVTCYTSAVEPPEGTTHTGRMHQSTEHVSTTTWTLEARDGSLFSFSSDSWATFNPLPSFSYFPASLFPASLSDFYSSSPFFLFQAFASFLARNSDQSRKFKIDQILIFFFSSGATFSVCFLTNTTGRCCVSRTRINIQNISIPRVSDTHTHKPGFSDKAPELWHACTQTVKKIHSVGSLFVKQSPGNLLQVSEKAPNIGFLQGWVKTLSRS